MICNKIINFQHGGLGRQIPSCLLSRQHRGCCREAARWQQPRIPLRQHSPRGCPGARWKGERLVEKQFAGLPCAVASNSVFWASPAQSSAARGGGSGREGGKGIPPGYLRSWKSHPSAAAHPADVPLARLWGQVCCPQGTGTALPHGQHRHGGHHPAEPRTQLRTARPGSLNANFISEPLALFQEPAASEPFSVLHM